MIGYLNWLGRMIGFAAHFVKLLFMASLDVARDVVAPNNRFSPGIVEFRLRCATELEITAMANAITLTPGTLSIATRADPPTVWVHSMYTSDRDQVLAELRDYEARMLRALRRGGQVEQEPGGGTAEPQPGQNREAQ